MGKGAPECRRSFSRERGSITMSIDKILALGQTSAELGLIGGLTVLALFLS